MTRRRGARRPRPGGRRPIVADRARRRRPAGTRQGARRPPDRAEAATTAAPAEPGDARLMDVVEGLAQLRHATAGCSSSWACSTGSIGGTPTCSAGSSPRRRGAAPVRRSSRSTPIPTRSSPGHAPPLLFDPQERAHAARPAGVEVTVVQHFDRALRETPYDAFVECITDRAELAGFLMTPDAAFGYQRGGTPDTLAALGATADPGWTWSIVPPFVIGGAAVRSSDIRAAIARGDSGCGHPARSCPCRSSATPSRSATGRA